MILSQTHMTLMQPHPIFTDYLITKDGDVINKKTGRKRKPQPDGNGYLIVGLYKDKKKHNKSIHRLLMETYNPIENDHLYHAHHKDEIRDNNRLENLEWELIGEHLREHKKGKVFSEEHRKKLSESHKGQVVSEETRKKMREAHKKRGSIPPSQKGMLFWNNGTKTIRSKEWPGDGWVRGRL